MKPLTLWWRTIWFRLVWWLHKTYKEEQKHKFSYLPLLSLMPLNTLRWCIFIRFRMNCATAELLLLSWSKLEESLEPSMFLMYDDACSLTSLKNSQENRMWYSSSMWTSGCGNWASISAFSTSVQHLQIRRWTGLLWIYLFQAV